MRSPKAALAARLIMWFAVWTLPTAACVERLFGMRIQVWDDAFMFIRYADHLIKYGMLIWNDGSPSTFGLTSPLYLAVTVPVRFFVEGPIYAGYVSSMICTVFFFILLTALVESTSYGDAGKFAAVLVLFVTMLFTAPTLAKHCESGMDTTFAMAYLCGWFISVNALLKKPTVLRGVVTGILAGLAFAARPDLLVFTGPGMIIVAAAGHKTLGRKIAFLMLCAAAATIVIQILAAYLITSSPLPLSFYAKSTAFYSNSTQVERDNTEFQNFLKTSWPLIIAALWSIPAAFRTRTVADVFSAAMLVLTVVFWWYYTFVVFQLMGYESRFYYPTVPALVYACTRGIDYATTKLESALGPRVWSHVAVGTLAVSIVAFGFATWRIAEAVNALPGWDRVALAFNPVVEYKSRYSWYWYKLDQFSNLPDDLVIATTEVGRPAALNPGKMIVDMAGLNETWIIKHGFSARMFFSKYRPDLIYLPHDGYPEVRHELFSDPIFKNEYEVFAADRLGTEFGLAIRRSSPYYEKMRHVLGQ
jgi:hypothetical protein